MWIRIEDDYLNSELITNFGLNDSGDSFVDFASGNRITRKGPELCSNLRYTLFHEKPEFAAETMELIYA